MEKNTETSSNSRVAQVLSYVGCGFLMGGADVIPGVSGGTVALVIGIYRRLVTALSHYDRELLRYLRHRQWSQAIAHLDLAFLFALACGILTGVVSLGGVMNQLLTSPFTRPTALAALFGMILASAFLVARMIRQEHGSVRVGLLPIGLAGAVFAAWLTGLDTMAANLAPHYVFLCGVIAISAMILPGISGAYLLLILGLYGHLTDILKALPRGQVTGDDVVTVIIFAAGCAVGLLTFSKLLRLLLVRFNGPTMALLCGFMVGALRKVWPFQEDLTPDVSKLSHKHFQTYIPDSIDSHVLLCTATVIVALTAVLALDTLARKRMSH